MGNINEALRIHLVIESTLFEKLATRWRNRGEYDAGSLVRTGAGVD